MITTEWNLTEMMQNLTDRARFLAQLKRHEGESLEAYFDTIGVLTVGVGHNCQASPVPGVLKAGDRITAEISDVLFLSDVEKHVRPLLERLPWISERLNAPRQAVLFNMSFNLGVAGLLKFKTTLRYAEQQKFTAASEQMMKSVWAKQVKGRSIELSEQMRTGYWQGEA